MKRKVFATGFAILLGLSACGKDEAETPANADEGVAAEGAAASPAPVPVADAPTPAAPPPAALPGAPEFVALFPGGEVQGAPLTAESTTDGPGGTVTFLTAASPQEVVAFYRGRAEASGLSSVMAMTQGETQAYGARSAQSGANLSVVASPVEGRTNVQLSWSAGA